jgi:hypothetical protein
MADPVERGSSCHLVMVEKGLLLSIQNILTHSIKVKGKVALQHHAVKMNGRVEI